MKTSEIYHKSYEMGRQGFINGLGCAPALNSDLIKWIITDFNNWDEKIMKRKIKLFKCYIKGWTFENLLRE